MEGYATLFTVMRLSVRYYLSIDDYNRNYISGTSGIRNWSEIDSPRRRRVIILDT